MRHRAPIELALHPGDQRFTRCGVRPRHSRRRHHASPKFPDDFFADLCMVAELSQIQLVQHQIGGLQFCVVATDTILIDLSLAVQSAFEALTVAVRADWPGDKGHRSERHTTDDEKSRIHRYLRRLGLQLGHHLDVNHITRFGGLRRGCCGRARLLLRNERKLAFGARDYEPDADAGPRRKVFVEGVME